MFKFDDWNKLGHDNLTLRMLAQDHNEVENRHDKEIELLAKVLLQKSEDIRNLRSAIVGGLVVIIAIIILI
jgi:hypothetical protein